MIFFAAVLVSRLFYLQIIRGGDFQDNYNLKLEKTETIPATRGNIYDRNGNPLAENKLVYAVTIQDAGKYSSKTEKQEKLNKEIATIVKKLEKNGDSIDNNFGIYMDKSGNFQFMYSNTNLQRFRADVFDHSSPDDLEYNDKLGFDEATATPDQIVDYLSGERVYNISTKYDKALRYKILVVRYNMGRNSYKKYISTVIASDISLESVAFIKENLNELVGVNIEQKSLRKYNDSEYFAHIIGYTGQISPKEYQELSRKDDSVEANDIIGKSGIEKKMNSYLSGKKGHESLYVDSMGNIIKKKDYVAAESGNDVYLSIDADLQKAAYILLEQEIAGILYSKIINAKEFEATNSDVRVPIYDVYYSLIKNGVIDISSFEDSDATSTEKAVLKAYKAKEKSVIATLKSQLKSGNETIYADLPKEYQAYSTYIVTYLKNTGIFDAKAIDASAETQILWTQEQMPVNKYLIYALEQNWIDITKYETETKYADTAELYNDLIDYLSEKLVDDIGFQRLVYKYLLLDDNISGSQLCMILYDQGVLAEDEQTYSRLASGAMTGFDFMRSKIKSLEITPGQIALDPCSGSTIIMDTKTGEVLAMVTYPGYDNNKLANSVDSDYYDYLTHNSSNPLYNYATQQKTAPGSTFKIVTSTAGLHENVITTTSEIEDQGIFTKANNSIKCWIYPPGTHGSINVSEALRDSCNYFFNEVGWRLSGGESFDEDRGIKKINEYASMYGLGEKTGIEIEENTPNIADKYPVAAAMGQSNHNFTTVALARYATAIANRGTVYNLTLLDHVQDANGNVIESYGPTEKNKVDVLNTEEWNAIHHGMRMVVENLSSYDNFDVNVAGKTGTAQEVKTRPNHALFIGFAPYENPEVSIATRIAYGYTSHNAAAVSKDILSYYFGVGVTEDLLSGEASEVSDSGDEFTD
ncbi:MAG: peptidoglycan glycosyltransferase [Pseudobutyrivibrio sp.]|nr:peptidoglycan glycosyltransferase [Pseudobutyrivibrio sp.]